MSKRTSIGPIAELPERMDLNSDTLKRVRALPIAELRRLHDKDLTNGVSDAVSWYIDQILREINTWRDAVAETNVRTLPFTQGIYADDIEPPDKPHLRVIK